jgi:hypothetical protein
MKKLLILLIVPVLMMLPATPALAQVNLPYTTVFITDSGAAPVGELTIMYSGMVIIQIDEAATNLRLSETQLYVGDEPPVNIKPEKFPFKHQVLGGAASDAYSVDLAAIDLNGDGVIYVAAQVNLTQTGLNPKNNKPFILTDTAWAQGDDVTASGFAGKGKGKNSVPYFSVILSLPG